MLVFPNCKINLGLQVRYKRNDGYHELATIFYPLPLCDAFEIIRAQATGSEVSFSSSGLPIPGNTASNLCIKAYHLLRQRYPRLPAVQMHLHKAIPMGAGLGGGSSDGAFALQLLVQMFALPCTAEELQQMALELGSDCPFFLYNRPCYATGRGEILEPLQLDLSGYDWLVVHPGIHVATGAAFAALQRTLTPPQHLPDLRTTIQLPLQQWKEVLMNDFEAPVFAMHPEIGALRNQLYAAGALYASMSGSGSAVYGIFQPGTLPQPDFPEHYSVIRIPAKNR